MTSIVSSNAIDEVSKFSALLERLSVHSYANLVDKYYKAFRCAFCRRVPESTCYLSSVCEHTFCWPCIAQETDFSRCPTCSSLANVDNIYPDPKFWIFTQCLSKKRAFTLQDMNKGGSITGLSGLKRPARYDYCLQEECRRLFVKSTSKDFTRVSEPDLDWVKLLLNFGANPNILNKNGWTLMHEAVDYGHAPILKLLLEGGGLVDAYSHDKSTTCLHDALDEEVINMEVVRLLLEYGADVGARDKGGVTARHKAQLKGIDLKCDTPRPRFWSIHLKHKPEEPPCLLGLDLSPSNSKLLNDFCHRFKIRLFDPRQKWIRKEVTHIVVESDPCPSSFPILYGILQGVYIVTVQWLEESLSGDEVLEASQFEVEGTEEYPGSGVPPRARISSVLLKPKLFSGGQINIMDADRQITPTEREQLVELIQGGGGKLLTRTSGCAESIGESFFFHSRPGSPLEYTSVIVLHSSAAPPPSPPPSRSASSYSAIAWFPTEWLYRAIQTYSILP